MNVANRLSLLICLLAAVTLCMVPAWLYVIHIAKKSLREGRFPPSGTKTLARARILHGEKAERTARLVLYLGYVLMILTLATAWYILFVFPEAFSFNDPMVH
jgi:hypothetical protein